MKPIAVVGSYNTGLAMEVDRLPEPGETLLGTGYSEGPGGKGSNQAVAARRLGGRVGLVACIGTDRYGDEALRLWEEEGVDARGVVRSPRHTGLGFVIVGKGGGNVITVDPGANMDLTAEQVARADAVKSAGALLVQLEIPMDAVAAAIGAAAEVGAKVILNPAPAIALGRGILAGVDVITPNEQEFRALAGTGDLESGAKAVLALGVGAVVVTLGEKGAYVATKDDSGMVPAPRVEAVDPTGAGDAFNGALAVALTEGEPLRQAVSFANYAGALTATRRQVIPALPRRAELDEFRRNDVLE